MKLIYRDFKKGLVKVRVEDNEDLWSLHKVINNDCFVSGSTTRVIKREGKDGRRKKVFLKIRVTKVEFMESAFILKVLGRIVEGPEDVPVGSYHSFNIEPGSELIIECSFNSYERNVLVKSNRKPIGIIAVVLDTHEAVIALINKGVKELVSLHSHLPRKEDPNYSSSLINYYKEVSSLVRQSLINQKTNNLIIAGPGFAAEGLIKLINNLKFFKAHTNHTGLTGVKELIKAGVIKQLVNDNEVSEETSLVDEFFNQVRIDKFIKYGFESVKQVVETGAVKLLLISEGVVRDFRERKRFKALENIINIVEKMKGKVEFISTRHDAGKRFYRFCGIGAILRFNV